MPIGSRRARRFAAGCIMFASVAGLALLAAAGRAHGAPESAAAVAHPDPSIEAILAASAPELRPIRAEPVPRTDKVFAAPAENPDAGSVWILMRPCRERTQLLGAYLTAQPCMKDSRDYAGSWCSEVARQDVTGPR